MPFDIFSFWGDGDHERELTLTVRCSDQKSHVFFGRAEGDWDSFWSSLQKTMEDEIGEKTVWGGMYYMEGRSCNFILSKPENPSVMIEEAKGFTLLWPPHLRYFTNVPLPENSDQFNLRM